MDLRRVTHHSVAACCTVTVAGMVLTACNESSQSIASTHATAVDITTPSGVQIVLIPAGEFWMGSDQGEADAAPRHLIRVSPFAIDKFEALQREFEALQMPDGSHFKGDDRPVEQIRWSDAALFCNERSRAEGLETCYDEATFACNFEASGYRLPTEAEWEYAARAGTSTDYPFGNGPHKLQSHACYAGNSAKQTSRAGQKKPNAWGLHDMLGNVAEWCHDVYSETYYQESPGVDPRGPASGPQRVIRGGSWKSSEGACSVIARMADVPGIADACFAQDTYGFRCVRRLSEEERDRVE